MNTNETDRQIPFSLHGLLGVCYIDFSRQDANGYYNVTTIIDTPHGRYCHESFLNPAFLSDYGDRVSDFLGQSCYKAYINELATT